MGLGRGSKADDDDIVTSQHEVDQNDLKKARQDIWAEKFKQESRFPSSSSCDAGFLRDSSPTPQPAGNQVRR
jgi:hypothetical protein